MPRQWKRDCTVILSPYTDQRMTAACLADGSSPLDDCPSSRSLHTCQHGQGLTERCSHGCGFSRAAGKGGQLCNYPMLEHLWRVTGASNTTLDEDCQDLARVRVAAHCTSLHHHDMPQRVV